MKRMVLIVVVFLLVARGSATAEAQTTIETDGDVQAQGFIGDGSQLTSVDAATLDGIDSSDFAQDADLQSAEAMLMALQAQVDALGLALVPRTGQTTCYDAAGAVVTCGTGIGLAQDGDLQLGVTWPNPRFTDNGDGTVTDHLTGLIWLEDADCFGTRNWADALAAANGLFDGSTNDPGGSDCGLSDGSIEGEWRLPNVRELQSLVHYGFLSPAVPNTAGTGKWTPGDPFASVQTLFYWSSTSGGLNAVSAFLVNFNDGSVGIIIKTNSGFRVWPVRGGQ